MNRLSVGAAALLLAVSFACLIPNIKADHDDDGLEHLMEKTISQKLFFIKTVRDILAGNDTDTVQSGIDNADSSDSVYYRVIFDPKLNQKLDWMEANGKGDLIDAYVKIMFNIFRKYEAILRNKLITDESAEEKVERMKAVAAFLDEHHAGADHAVLKPLASAMSLEIYDEIATGHHADDEMNQHVHTKTWNHDQWNKVYHALPATSKYQYTGLTPQDKKHLSKSLLIVDKDNYEKEKHDSELSILHRAFKAKIEAISSSTTSAGDYFNSHQDAIDEMKEHFDDHHH